METILTVEGMSCGHCKNAVETGLGKLDGVTSVAVDLETKKVVVEHDTAVAVAALEETIEDQGYDVVK